MAKPNGVIVYEGPSEIDGQPIVVIVTGLKRTDNRKTGTMLQSWILLQNTPPCDAANQGADVSICGDCKHRTWGTCYVNLGHSPYNVYNAYKRGSYPWMDVNVIRDIKDRTLRIGSYGDPAAVPHDVWKLLINSIKGITGYTHQWKFKANQHLSNYCMASVDSIAEAQRAKKLGFRTFRIILEGEELLEDEYYCPALDGKATCDNCLSCNGFANGGDKKNPVIILHGSSYKVRRYKRIMELRNRKKGFKHLLPQRLA